MAWQQLHLDTDAASAPALSDALAGLGALSTTFRDIEDEPVYEPAPGTEPLWRRTRVTALFDAGTDLDAVLDALATRFGDGLRTHARIESLEDQPWERAWMRDFAPMRFGKRLWICPSWTPPPDPGAVNILMDPGLAFGTGTHPTTALCLEWLDAHPPRDQAVIDYGCGSGVLAIAAALLGARTVLGVDNDPQALLATRENAQRNGVTDRVSTSMPGEIPGHRADLLLSNILANPLCELAPEFSRRVRGGGSIVLSGILANQADAVTAAYAADFEGFRSETRDDWVRLAAVRRKG
jgi:ribosomal protein L11 methyltransferase